MDQYFLANDVEDVGKQRAILITVIGSQTYTLLKNLLHPELPSSKSYAELTEKLKEHLCPAPIKIAERYKFYEAKQKPDEQLAQYLARLRKMTEHCDFGNFLEDALRDKFVCGIADENITLEKFCSEKRRSL